MWATDEARGALVQLTSVDAGRLEATDRGASVIMKHRCQPQKQGTSLMTRHPVSLAISFLISSCLYAAGAPDALKPQVHTKSPLFDVTLALAPERTPVEQGFWLGFGMDAQGDGFVVQVGQRGAALLLRKSGRVEELGRAEFAAGFWSCPKRTITLSGRPRRVFVAFDGDRVLTARVDTLPGDGVGELGLPKAALLAKPKIERRGRPSFNDQFDTPDAVPNTWKAESGKWEIEAPVDPLIARNENFPMYSLYTGGGKRAVATTGHASWDFYAAEATCNLREADACGLAFYWRGEANHGELVLRRRGDACEPQLRWVRGGQVRFLTTKRRFDARQWHRLRIEALGERVWAYVDGELLLAAHDIGLHAGKVGLLATGKPAAFDDVSVDPFDAEVLVGPTPTPLPAQWPGVRVRAAVAAKATTSLLLEGKPGAARFEMAIDSSKRTCTLTRWAGGKSVVCGEAKLQGRPAALIDLAASRGRVVATVDGKHMASWIELGFEPTHVAFAGGGGVGRGAWARVEPWEPKPALVCEYAFDMPRVMLKTSKKEQPLIGTRFKTGAGEWAVRDARLECVRGAGVLWSGQPCPGDAAASIDVLDPGPGAGLRISADRKQPGTGYAATLAKSGGRVVLTLRRGPRVVASKPVPAASPTWPRRLFIEREGEFVAAGIDRTALLVWRDPTPLSGDRVAIEAAGANAAFSNFTIEHLSARQYSFEFLAPAWRQTGGSWTLHSGLSCIPWDHWLTADGRKQQAVTWLREKQPADVAVQFDVSEITIGTDDPNTTHHHYPYHDITLAVCADGRDLMSGYAVEIGADRGACLRIRKRGKIIFETSEFTISMGRHCNTPRQVNCYFRKLGNRLILRLNGRVLADWVDPEPLAGGYVALAAKDCRANFSDVLIMPETAPYLDR